MMDGILITALRMQYDVATNENLHLRNEKAKAQGIKKFINGELSNWDKAIKTSSDYCRDIDRLLTEKIKNQYKKWEKLQQNEKPDLLDSRTQLSQKPSMVR